MTYVYPDRERGVFRGEKEPAKAVASLLLRCCGRGGFAMAVRVSKVCARACSCPWGLGGGLSGEWLLIGVEGERMAVQRWVMAV